MPSVFISYSHDTLDHKNWVINLSSRLRSNGIDAKLDQWEVSAGGDLVSFMEQGIVNSDYVVMICSERYVEKCNNGEGGVGFEKSLAISPMLKKIDESKIIPIVKQSSSSNLPSFLHTKKYINFSNDAEYEANIDELSRTILKAPLYEKPPLGVSPFEAQKFATEGKKADPVKNVMKAIYDTLEHSKSAGAPRFGKVRESFDGSVALFHYCLSLAHKQELISPDWTYHVRTTEKGFEFMVNHFDRNEPK